MIIFGCALELRLTQWGMVVWHNMLTQIIRPLSILSEQEEVLKTSTVDFTLQCLLNCGSLCIWNCPFQSLSSWGHYSPRLEVRFWWACITEQDQTDLVLEQNTETTREVSFLVFVTQNCRPLSCQTQPRGVSVRLCMLYMLSSCADYSLKHSLYQVPNLHIDLPVIVVWSW